MLLINIKPEHSWVNRHEFHFSLEPDRGKMFRQIADEPGKLVYIQADGDELSYILDKFHSIRWTRDTKVIRWYGEDARFILGNL